MARDRSTGEEIFSKSLGFAIALGSLAFGVAAAMMNNERTRQMQEELRQRMDELGRKMEDFSAQAQGAIQDRRPEIEDTIQRSRRAAVDGLEKAKGVVEQGADKAQEYVQRMSQQAQQAAKTSTNGAQGGTSGSSEQGSAQATATKAGQPTKHIGAKGNGEQGKEPISYDETDNPGSY